MTCLLDPSFPPWQPRGCMAKRTKLLGVVAEVTDLRAKLRAAAEEQKTTLGSVAQSVGVTRQYLERVTEEGTMPAELYIAVCIKLGIDPSVHTKITSTTRKLIGQRK